MVAAQTIISALALIASISSGVDAQGRNNAQYSYLCGATHYKCGAKIRPDTICLLGKYIKVVDGTADQCTKLAANRFKICPNGKPMTSYVEYNSKGERGVKFDANGKSGPCLGAHCGGDPHFLTFDGTYYDYHGQCDLVMASSKNLENSGFDLDIHSRTKIIADWSYMSNIALRIGSDILEVTSKGEHYINGAPVELPFMMMNTFNVSHILKEVFPQQFRSDYVVDLSLGRDGNAEKIRISAFKDLLSVNIDTILSDTAGMLGIMGKEGMYGRDRATQITDVNAMGQEWQVTSSEPMLFKDVNAPQYPEKCMLPVKKEKSVRSLRGDDEQVQRRAAEACDAVEEPIMKSFCIQDILMSGDHEVAGLYHGK